MNFTPLNNGMSDGFCLIKSLEKKMSARSKPYLDVILADASGDISAKLWDYEEAAHAHLTTDMMVKVRGILENYNGKPQFKIIHIRTVNDTDGIRMSDLIPNAPYDNQWMYSQLIETANGFTDQDFKKLVIYMLEQKKEQLLICPAALSLHHAIRSGLLYHVTTIVRLAERFCEVYPFIDKDLLLSGAILHDLAKIEELEFGDTGVASKYTLQGNLMGHLIMGTIQLEKAGETLDIPKEKLMLIQHMIISHHGQPDFGSPVRPMFIEAEILSELDLMDARMYEMVQALSDVPEGEFSARQWALDQRKLLNHGRTKTDTNAKID